MLLDDSLEIDEIPASASDAELVPMIKLQDVQLSNIWIPSELLLNRQFFSQISSNVHQSAISRTLVKHNVVDSLSIYNDAGIQKSIFHSSEKLLDSLEQLPPNYLDTEQTHLQEANEGETYSCSFSCLNTDNSEFALDISKVKNDSCSEEKFDSPDNSIADYLEHLNISDDEEENSVVGIINDPGESETPISTLDYLSDKKVLESCDVEISTKSACNVPVETDICPLNDEEVQDSVRVSFSSPDQMEDLFEVSEKLWNDLKLNNENSSVGIENIIFSNQTGGTRDTVEGTSPGQSSELSENPSDLSNIKNPPEEVHLFPFVLQKSKDECLSTVVNSGKSNKKEKRVKKKASKKIPLDNFFLSNKEAADSDSGYLAFCESLRQKNSYGDTFENNELSSHFPYATELNAKHKPECPDSFSNCVTNSISDSSPPVNCSADSTSIDHNLTKYVIENIPSFVNGNMLQNLIATFGDIIIKNIVMKMSGKTKKALIEVSLEDPNWLIECLHESQPFGAFDECLKCYQIL